MQTAKQKQQLKPSLSTTTTVTATAITITIPDPPISSGPSTHVLSQISICLLFAHTHTRAQTYTN